MADPLDMAAKLLALADPARNNQDHERTAAAVKLADMIRSGRVTIAASGTAPSPKVKQPEPEPISSAFDGFRSALEREMVKEGVRQAQRLDDINALRPAAEEAFKALFEMPIELRRSEVGSCLIAMVIEIQTIGDAIQPRFGKHDPTKLGASLQQLGKLLMERRVVRASDRSESLYETLDDLFKASGELPGADMIAKMVGARAADVRREIKKLIEWHHIEPVGSGRSRRYRWIPPEERPDDEG